MIQFNNLNQSVPYSFFKKLYVKALDKGQKNVDAISISSYNTIKKEVDSRFVNLKFINNNEFIFFSNYNSPKAEAFNSYNQISALFFWPSINTQIRIKAIIKKTSNEFNNKYFKQRLGDKNTLAISSQQSKMISSFDLVIEKYEDTKKKQNLFECPDYWGGYSFTPYEIEFWEGNSSRINKRNLYSKNKGTWQHSILEP